MSEALSPFPPPRPRKHPSDELASLAGRVLSGGGYTAGEVRKLAAAVLSLDVTPGPNKGRPHEGEAK